MLYLVFYLQSNINLQYFYNISIMIVFKNKFIQVTVIMHLCILIDIIIAALLMPHACAINSEFFFSFFLCLVVMKLYYY